jgi:hypothetical protein
MIKEELPEPLQDAIVNDIDIHFYDKNESVRVAFQQGKQVTRLPDAIVSNFEYAMQHLVPYHERVLFVHATIDQLECVYSIVWKEYSKAIVYEIMIDHSNGFHKQVPYQLYKSIHPLKEVKKLELQQTTTIEKIGWLPDHADDLQLGQQFDESPIHFYLKGEKNMGRIEHIFFSPTD